MKKTLLQFFSLLVALLSWGANAQAASQLTVTYLAANETSVTRNSPSAPFMVSVDVSFLNLTNQPVAMQIGIGYYDVATGVSIPTWALAKMAWPYPSERAWLTALTT